MNFTLIICTYKRAQPLLKLLHSVREQSLYPYEILIVDGSPDDETATMLIINDFKSLIYYKVPPEHRGLTKQRNYGITRVDPISEIVCFLDDDTVLEPKYFEEILKTFHENNTITGVGGIAINENRWIERKPNGIYDKKRFYTFEDYVYPEGIRNIARNYLGLQSHLTPGKMPNYSHGRTCGFPLNNKTYEVDLLIGMSFSFRRIVFENTKFSTFFEGYGLYEDADYSIRALQFGKNVVNTAAQLSHYHAPSGRPNQYDYGKMVVRNGWYVWRVKYPNPSLKAQLKWHAITLLLTAIRFTNIFTTTTTTTTTTTKRKEAATETLGRVVGWMGLWV
ncbi:glycosyltransferase family 2 protein [Flavobacterium sp.]|uniref:glycosyltransferase family 2 protein n=1 Tax=Flavobacterium sp. TaxID=239 RepID=UPI002B4B244B|nr:glycosyltransferase family 2 protein [Flavobacterium sp.]HLF51241.1 glycosyltransferase family 2 protein [Flavobacterium sp.]